MVRLNLIVGSGGILSHAPRRVQSMIMMIDAYQPIEVTTLSVDSIFMMPHLGVLSTVHDKAATDVFARDCMIYLGSCVSVMGEGKIGEKCLEYKITFPDGKVVEDSMPFGELKLYPLEVGQRAVIEAKPTRSFDFGIGRGKSIKKELDGGVVGIVIDTRGRPLVLPENKTERVALLNKWAKTMNLYP
ncbi:MAG: glutamate mutase L [Planctomycetota bacterium]